MIAPTAEEVALLREHPEWKSLLEHPAYKNLIATARGALLASWSQLLTVKPEKLEAMQGFIDGINYVLEYADARVSSAEQLLAARREDDEATVEQALARAKDFRERRHRAGRLGADL